MSIESKIEDLTIARNNIRNKMRAAGQATATDKLTTLATNLVISSGTDTSDATATADDILAGKTAYANNEKLTGTISIATSAEISQVVDDIFSIIVPFQTATEKELTIIFEALRSGKITGADLYKKVGR